MILPFLVIGLIFGAMIGYMIKRVYDATELSKYGVDAKATVLEKKLLQGGRSTDQYYIRYRYADAQGASHEYTSLVDGDMYQKYNIGDTIDIVYSSRKPGTSMPKYRIAFAMKQKG